MGQRRVEQEWPKVAKRASTADVRQLGQRIARDQAQEIVELRGLQQTLG